MSPLSALVLSKFEGVWVDIFLVLYWSAALQGRTPLLIYKHMCTLCIVVVWHDEQTLATQALGPV